MARAGVDRMKRSGWKPPRQPSNAAGDQHPRVFHHDGIAELTAPSRRPEERSPPRGGPSAHTRSTSTRWSRRPSNPVGGHHSTAVDRTLSSQAEMVAMPSSMKTAVDHHSSHHNMHLAAAVAPPVYSHAGEEHSAAAMDYLGSAARIPLQMAMAPSVQIEQEWAWLCNHARQHKCNLVDGVVCKPPDVEIVVGVAVTNEQVLKRLEASEREACDLEFNIRASLTQTYEE